MFCWNWKSVTELVGIGVEGVLHVGIATAVPLGKDAVLPREGERRLLNAMICPPVVSVELKCVCDLHQAVEIVLERGNHPEHYLLLLIGVYDSLMTSNNLPIVVGHHNL